MRAVAIAVIALVLLAGSVVADEDLEAPGRVNRILDTFATPQLEPGGSGVLSFHLNNPYPDAMTNVSLTAEVYFYATIEESSPVDANWTHPFPRFREADAATPRRAAWPVASLAPGTNVSLEATVETSADMPHGSVFSQSSYFVRFWLEFDYPANANNSSAVVPGRGYFTLTEWEAATTGGECNPVDCKGGVNLTRLGSFLDRPRVNGILPDTAFGVKEPIPVWPFYALVVVMAFFLVLAFLFWVEENPGEFPRVEAAWARFRGVLRQRLPSLRGRRKPQEKA